MSTNLFTYIKWTSVFDLAYHVSTLHSAEEGVMTSECVKELSWQGSVTCREPKRQTIE